MYLIPCFHTRLFVNSPEGGWGKSVMGTIILPTQKVGDSDDNSSEFFNLMLAINSTKGKTNLGQLFTTFE